MPEVNSPALARGASAANDNERRPPTSTVSATQRAGSDTLDMAGGVDVEFGNAPKTVALGKAKVEVIGRGAKTHADVRAELVLIGRKGTVEKKSADKLENLCVESDLSTGVTKDNAMREKMLEGQREEDLSASVRMSLRKRWWRRA